MEPFIRILVISRPHVDFQAKFNNTCRVDISAGDSGIDVYLKSEINTKNRLSKFTAKYPKLEEKLGEV